jgi:hypothetical protein
MGSSRRPGKCVSNSAATAFNNISISSGFALPHPAFATRMLNKRLFSGLAPGFILTKRFFSAFTLGFVRWMMSSGPAARAPCMPVNDRTMEVRIATFLIGLPFESQDVTARIHYIGLPCKTKVRSDKDTAPSMALGLFDQPECSRQLRKTDVSSDSDRLLQSSLRSTKLRTTLDPNCFPLCVREHTKEL